MPKGKTWTFELGRHTVEVVRPSVDDVIGAATLVVAICCSAQMLTDFRADDMLAGGAAAVFETVTGQLDYLPDLP